MKRRRPAPEPVPPMIDPSSRNVRLLEAGEVTQARAEARREYEQRLAVADASPSLSDLERWYGDDGTAGG